MAASKGSDPTPLEGSAIVGTSGKTSVSLGWVDPPDDLKLQQVHYLIRHGERSPVRTRLLNASTPIPARWNMCHAGRKFKAAVFELQNEGEISAIDWKHETFRGTVSNMNVRRELEAIDEKERILPLQAGECFLGELTDLGRASTHLIGTRLRDLYVKKLSFLPEKLEEGDSKSVYFRSTNMSRTIESLESVIRGLLPQTRDTSATAYTPTVLLRNGISENLLPNTFGCGRLRNLDKEFSKLAASIHNPQLASLDAILAPEMDGAPPRVDGHPRLSGILDTVRASKAHGIEIPKPFQDEKTMLQVEKAVVDEWFIGYKTEDDKIRTQYRRLAMGRLLKDLGDKLNEKASKPKSPLKLAVYSLHDTSLAGLLSTLDVFDNHWPAFTASIGLELFKKKKSKGVFGYLGLGADEHFIRMRYGDRTLRLPACSKAGDHLSGRPEFCTLQAFNRAVEGVQHPEGKTWEQECEEDRPERSSK